MKLSVRLLEGFKKTYLPLQFRAFWNDEGYCYLKVQIIDGKMIFFCAQLLNYYNTSITNAVESVRASAVNALINDGAIKINNQQGVFDLFKSQERKGKEVLSILFEYIRQNSVWVEHYESQISITQDERYSLVHFNQYQEPSWSFISKENLEEKYPEFDFHVSRKTLEDWRNARLSTQAIKKILKEKNWTMKEVAVRWNRSESWMSKVVNDEQRELYWEDAFKGLPSKIHQE